MRTYFQMGVREGIGQIPGPINWPVQTPVPAPAVPPPPAKPVSVPRVVDEKTKAELLDLIAKAKADRNRIAAWWEATPKAREILGDKLGAYQQHLTSAMSFETLVDTLEWRLAQPGEVYIKDQELADLMDYQEEVQKLVEVVEGKAQGPIPSAGGVSSKDFIFPGIVALLAYTLPIL